MYTNHIITGVISPCRTNNIIKILNSNAHARATRYPHKAINRGLDMYCPGPVKLTRANYLPNSGDDSKEGGGRECLERIFEIQT